jgi:uncharacterized ferredoxin-like protein
MPAEYLYLDVMSGSTVQQGNIDGTQTGSDSPDALEQLAAIMEAVSPLGCLKLPRTASAVADAEESEQIGAVRGGSTIPECSNCGGKSYDERTDKPGKRAASS